MKPRFGAGIVLIFVAEATAARHQAREAACADEGLPDEAASEAVVAERYRVVWSRGDHRAIERSIAPRYVIHSDPGDPWEGQTLDRRGYEERVEYSRSAFPDLVFTVRGYLSMRSHDPIPDEWLPRADAVLGAAGAVDMLSVRGRRRRDPGRPRPPRLVPARS